MDSRNLAIVFAPILLRPPADKNSQDQSYIASLLGDSMHAYKLMEIFIVHYNDLLGVCNSSPLFLHIFVFET